MNPVRVNRSHLIIFALWLCSSNLWEAAAKPAIRIVTTVYPWTALTHELLRTVTDAEVSTLSVSAVGCPHDALMTPQDMMQIQHAHLVIANGGGVESASIVKSLSNTDATKILNLWETQAAANQDPHLWMDLDSLEQALALIHGRLLNLLPPAKKKLAENFISAMDKVKKLKVQRKSSCQQLARCALLSLVDELNPLWNDCTPPEVFQLEDDPTPRKLQAALHWLENHPHAAIVENRFSPSRTTALLKQHATISSGKIDPLNVALSAPKEYDNPSFYQRMQANFITLAQLCSAKEFPKESQ